MALTERQKVYAAMDKANGIKKPKPLKTVSSLKTKAWKFCSIYVRMLSADRNGMVECYTCGVKKHWKQMQAGHLVPGRGHSILFDLRGIRPQCYQCNCRCQGMTVAFLIHLEQEVGVEQARAIRDELHLKAKQPHPYSHEEMFELIEWFKIQIGMMERRN